MTPLGRVQAALEAAGSRRQGALSWTCPVHDDQRASLSVKEGRDGRVLLHCHAGCHPEDVLAALGLGWSDLFPEGRNGKKAEISTTYDYTDERGQLLYEAVRYYPKDFKRRRPDGNGGWTWSLKGTRLVLYRLPKVLAAIEAGDTVYVVEGERDAHAVERAGAVATTNIGGANGTWRPDFSQLLAKTKVVVVADNDDPGRKRARKLAAGIQEHGGQVEVVRPALDRDKADISDHLAAGFGLDDLIPLDSRAPSDISGAAPELPARCTLDTVEELFELLVSTGDKVALRATLATYAANMHLPGDAVWLGLVSGSSTGKTETATALAQTPSVYVRATVSGEAALLSGTPAKDRAPGATGGLLRRVGDRGVLVLKDFTSVLGMHREKRGVILAALREVYDGHWSREIGGEGGALLEWRGKLGMVMCCTTAYDRAHEVIAQMGDRFLLIRLDDDDPERGLLDALEGAGQEADARSALAAAVAGLLGHPPTHQPLNGDRDDHRRLVKLANFVTLARSPVARDYRGEIELVMDREAPHRFGKQLYALWRACGLLGMTRDQAWEVAQRVARDSLPKLRWRTLAALAKAGEQSTNTIARAVHHPYRSAKRTLEDLAAHGVVTRTTVELEGTATRDFWRLTDAGEATKLLLDAVPEMSDPPQADRSDP